MRHAYALAALPLLFGPALLAQPTFTSRPDLVGGTASGNCMAATDMNGDGRDDLSVLDHSRNVRVFYQNADGRFVPYEYGTVSASEDQWGMAIADIDNDGHKDVYSGGYYDGVHYMRIAAPGDRVMTELGGNLFMQCASLGDLDNNGWLDALGCDDNSAPKVWLNNNNGDLLLAGPIDFTTNPMSDMSGNYGSVFTDFDLDGDIDLYIAHCRQGVNDPNDPRRWDRLFVNDGTGHFTDEATARGVLNTWQTWAVDFGDWDNDGDLDLVTVNHDRDMQLMENDGTGHFTEIDDNGLDVVGFLLEVHMEDFDNDGFLDIVIGGTPGYYLQGHGDGTFTRIDGLFLNGGKPLHSFAIGDLNNDGAMDLWASYGDGYTTPDLSRPDQLWMNDGNSNHWLNVKLEGVESNRDAVGAHVVLTTALGTQVREVRAGESYGLTNTAICHFGLGANTAIDAVTIHWPSGQVDTYTGIEADQNITFVEGTCIAPVVSITGSTGLSICDGTGSLELTATTTAGSLHWSTGDDGAATTVEAPGYYTVTADAGDGCTAMTSVFISSSAGEPPTISAEGSIALCPQDHVVLTSSPAASYAWSTGATTQSIDVSEPGDYWVTVVNGCPDLMSGTVSVTARPAPEAPTVPNVSIPVPGTAELIASIDDVVWYDAAEGGSAIGSGSPWTTPFVDTDVTFWCATAGETTTQIVFGGMTDHASGAPPENSNAYFPIINVTSPIIVKSVKMYAQFAGPRVIALVTWPGATVISQDTYMVPEGENRVQLDLPIGTGIFGLRVLDSDPGLTYDYNTAYPYPFGTAASLIGVSNGGTSQTTTSYYELFYDWEVQVGATGCESERVPVQVLVGPTGVGGRDASGLAVYPVPARDRLNIAFGTITGPADVELLDLTGRLVKSVRMTAGPIVKQLDIAGLAPGGYSLRIRHGGGTATKRIIVQ